jgi:hypothetical protein
MTKLVDLVNRHLDMEEKELYELFTKRMDIASNIWLFVVGFIVGYVSTFATSILNLSSIAGTLWGYSPYLSLFIVAIIGLAVYAFAQVVYTGFYGINPIHAQERLLKDYLDARKIIRDRAQANLSLHHP